MAGLRTSIELEATGWSSRQQRADLEEDEADAVEFVAAKAQSGVSCFFFYYEKKTVLWLVEPIMLTWHTDICASTTM